MPLRSPVCAPAGAAPDAVVRLCCQGMLVAHVQVIGWNRKHSTEISFQLFKQEEVISKFCTDLCWGMCMRLEKGMWQDERFQIMQNHSGK